MKGKIYNSIYDIRRSYHKTRLYQARPNNDMQTQEISVKPGVKLTPNYVCQQLINELIVLGFGPYGVYTTLNNLLSSNCEAFPFHV